MRNIRFLSKTYIKKDTTSYAVFFDHGDVYARLDWELDGFHDNVSPELVGNLMLQQLENDLNDEATLDAIRRDNKADATEKGKRIQMYLDDGWIEFDVPEFKAKAVEKFGSE